MDDNSSSWVATEVEPEAVTHLSSSDQAEPEVLVVEPALSSAARAGWSLGSGSRLVVQIAVVLGSALVVGVAAFGLFQTLATSDSDPTAEDNIDDALIQPGPEFAAETGGSDRADSDGSGAESDRAVGLPAGTGSTLLVADGSDTAEESAPAPFGAAANDAEASGQSTTSTEPATSTSAMSSSTTSDPDTSDPDNGASTSTTAPPTTSATTASSTSLTSSTSSSSSPTTSSTTQPTTVPTTTPPTEPTTTTQPTTTTTRRTTSTTRLTTSSSSTVPTTVTTVPTTSTVPTTASTVPTTAPTTLPERLIASPADRVELRWESNQTFTVNEVPGAREYCWTFTSNGLADEGCTSSPTYVHAARRLDPGPTVVKVKAIAASRTLTDDRITVQLRAQSVLARPTEDETVEIDRDLDLRSKFVRTADRYCWALIQGQFNSGNICNTSPRLEVASEFLHDTGIDDGVMRIVARAYRGSSLIGRHPVDLRVVHDD